MGLPRDVVQAWAADIPHGRVGMPTDVDEAVALVAPDAASYITGDVLGVSGGIGIHTRP